MRRESRGARAGANEVVHIHGEVVARFFWLWRCDAIAMIPQFLLCVTVMVPVQMEILSWMARFVTWLRERRYSKAGAVAVALAWVVPTTVIAQGMMLTLPFPNQIADPGWVHDDDGLSETGRMNFKMQFLMTIAAGVVLATNAVFK